MAAEAGRQAGWKPALDLPNRGYSKIAPEVQLAHAVIQHKVAWTESSASACDEWMELYNSGAADIDLTGWTLSDGGDINIALTGKIAPGAYWLLERTDNTTVSDEAADQLYTGGLSNSGEQLTLRDATGAVVDTANAGAGAWPAGSAATHASMERKSGLVPEASLLDWLANASPAQRARQFGQRQQRRAAPGGCRPRCRAGLALNPHSRIPKKKFLKRLQLIPRIGYISSEQMFSL